VSKWEIFGLFLTLINHNNCSAHLLRIFIKPLPEAIRKGRQRSEQGEKAEKMEFWICVCYYLVCTGPPLPLPYLARDLPHSPAAMVIRTGGTARSPPLCYPHPISAVRDLSSESLWWPLFWRSWVYKLILDSDGDHFLFSPIFNMILVSRDIDCYSLAKISEILARANTVDSAEPNSKEMLWHMPQHFVDVRFLSTRDFCRRKNFVDASILSTPTFCRRQYFPSTPTFLSEPIFCRRQYFFAVNILLTPIFFVCV
jgi:hypothetical protein